MVYLMLVSVFGVLLKLILLGLWVHTCHGKIPAGVRSNQQLVDIFNQGLVKSTFEYIGELLMGWWSSRWLWGRVDIFVIETFGLMRDDYW